MYIYVLLVLSQSKLDRIKKASTASVFCVFQLAKKKKTYSLVTWLIPAMSISQSVSDLEQATIHFIFWLQLRVWLIMRFDLEYKNKNFDWIFFFWGTSLFFISFSIASNSRLNSKWWPNSVSIKLNQVRIGQMIA